MAKVEPIMVDLKVDNKAIKQIRKFKKQSAPIPTPLSNPIIDMLVSIAGIFMIFPAIIYGAFTFFGAGFKAGIESAIRMYNELMDDSKKWAR